MSRENRNKRASFYNADRGMQIYFPTSSRDTKQRIINSKLKRAPLPTHTLGLFVHNAVKTHILIFQILKLKSKPESPRTLWPIQAAEYVQIIITKKVCLGHRPCSYSEMGSDDGKKKIIKTNKQTALGIFRYKDIIFLGLFIRNIKSSFGFMFKLVSDGV